MFPILTNTYFPGAGLMDIGLKAGGLTLQQSFEIDSVCCDTMRRNFSHDVVQCDITKKLVLADKKCHVMVATYPCTRYSPIADIHGVRTGDDLFLHFFRHVAIRRPELYVVENVPGMKKFPVVMEAMTSFQITTCMLPAQLRLRHGCLKSETDLSSLVVEEILRGESQRRKEESHLLRFWNLRQLHTFLIM